MSVLMYRGHSFAGLEWADRFQPELLAAATAIPSDVPDETAFMVAYRWTNQFTNASAYAKALTLRAALEQHKLDCVRATDMMGAIFRDAGRTGFGHVRWSAGTTGHSVAAHLWVDNGKLKRSVADPFQQLDTPEVWPDSYFHGHPWPAVMEGSPPPPYAVELYVRGLDNYMFAEGYVIRGPNAGWLTKAGLPYAPVHKDASTTKVYEGPYPG